MSPQDLEFLVREATYTASQNYSLRWRFDIAFAFGQRSFREVSHVLGASGHRGSSIPSLAVRCPSRHEVGKHPSRQLLVPQNCRFWSVATPQSPLPPIVMHTCNSKPQLNASNISYPTNIVVLDILSIASRTTTLDYKQHL